MVVAPDVIDTAVKNSVNKIDVNGRMQTFLNRRDGYLAASITSGPLSGALS